MIGCLVSVLFGSTPARAGTISISARVITTMISDRLIARLSIANSGDEAARSVAAAVTFGGREVRPAVRPVLAAGGSMDAEVELPLDKEMRGQWPLVSTVDYTDGNGHAFQALQVSVVSLSKATPSLIAILDVTVEPVVTSGAVNV